MAGMESSSRTRQQYGAQYGAQQYGDTSTRSQQQVYAGDNPSQQHGRRRSNAIAVPYVQQVQRNHTYYNIGVNTRAPHQLDGRARALEEQAAENRKRAQMLRSGGRPRRWTLDEEQELQDWAAGEALRDSPSGQYRQPELEEEDFRGFSLTPEWRGSDRGG